MSAWNDERTAELYERFTRDFPMYDATSRDLVELAGIAEASRVLDLCCGTGATTRAVLRLARPDAEVVALDGSRAMLGVAQRVIDDERVRFVSCDAVALDDHVDDVDAIVCNSAIWQTDMERVFAAAAKVLRPGGRFAFNIGRQFMVMPFTEDELRPSRPAFWQYVSAVATLEHDYVAPMRGGGRMLSEDVVRGLVTGAGLRVGSVDIRTYETSVAQDRAWLEIPVFADGALPGMGYDDQLAVIEKAWSHVDAGAVDQRRWACFVAVRD